LCGLSLCTHNFLLRVTRLLVLLLLKMPYPYFFFVIHID
jgi:hypothetical protein